MSALATALAAACTAPAQTVCPDDVLCPPGKVCDRRGGCAFAEQLTSCVDDAHGTPCSYIDGAGKRIDGLCDHGLCLPLGCGNGVVTTDETCDDGNTQHGDGCSADCLSDETCGNGTQDPAKSEQCDDGNLSDGDGCQSTCKRPRCGDGVVDASLSEACDAGDANSDAPDASCRPNCQLPRCADGIVDVGRGEVCDDGNLVPADGCAADCGSDETCGNGVHDAIVGELCDDGNQLAGDGCAADCRSVEACGDGVLDTARGEVCDDSNTVSGDGCSADCKSRETCGNGIVDTATGEACDAGPLNSDAPDAPCRTSCQRPRCGDGIVDTALGDGCDLGFLNSDAPDAACRVNCQPQRCGDGIVDGGLGEVCDDSNQLAGDGCSADCRSNEECGNDIIDVVTGEQCDEGVRNADEPDALCRVSCELPRCGDAIRDTLRGEACDSGALNSDTPNAPCRTSCQLPRCGDLLVDTTLGEVCDDANAVAGDGCSPDCRSLEECGNGILDVVTGEQCDDGNTSNADACRTNCTVVRCGDGIVDANEQCDLASANSNAPNATCRLNCLFPRCGDGIRDDTLGELCDDGNQIFGDGCRPDCKALDICGDGVVDVTLGETCDDGNTRARDGCSACQPEDAVVLQTGVTPEYISLLTGPLAYDAARKQTVLWTSGATARTYEWNGAGWTLMQPRHSPAPRTGASLAYDPIRHRVVLFGGVEGSVYKNDTWVWDGEDWRDVSSASAPSPRAGAAMAFDANRGRLVLFGGTNSSVFLNDTWEWTGTTWSPLTVTGTPTGGANRKLAFDAAHNYLVMYQNVYSLNSHTWIFDGTTLTWADMGLVSTSVATTCGAHVAYDPSRGAVVMWKAGQTYEWSGTAWVADGTPTASHCDNTGGDLSLSYDAARRQLVAHGGPGTWLGTPTGWAAAPAWVAPAARTLAAAAYDPGRGKIVIYGGQAARSATKGTDPFPRTLSDTWEWDGRRWVQVMATMPPSLGARAGQMAAYDPSTGDVVMFGGGSFDGTTRTWFADLHTFDGAAWSPAAMSTGRPGIANSAMVFDAERDEIVTFGGAIPNATPSGSDDPYSQDTWTWHASAGWVQKTPAAKPPSRRNHLMGYDPIRKRTVLFGGKPVPPPGFPWLADTWEWDGTTWSLVATSGPINRIAGALVFNADAQRLMLVGGFYNIGFGNTGTAELWEWSGSAWAQRPVANPSAPGYRAAIAYDHARHYLLVFGGKQQQASVTNAITQLVRYRANATVEACTFGDLDYDGDGLAGCADPECWSVCAPLCSPGMTGCASSPICGDGMCDPLEDCDLCPTDCGACPGPLCGDFRCNGSETPTTCRHDCN